MRIVTPMKISSREQIIGALPDNVRISPASSSARIDLVVFKFPSSTSSERLFLDILVPRWITLDRSAPAALEVASQLFGVLKNLGVQIDNLRAWLYDRSCTALDRCISGDTYGNVIVASSRGNNGGISFHCKFL